MPDEFARLSRRMSATDTHKRSVPAPGLLGTLHVELRESPEHADAAFSRRYNEDSQKSPFSIRFLDVTLAVAHKLLATSTLYRSMDILRRARH